MPTETHPRVATPSQCGANQPFMIPRKALNYMNLSMYTILQADSARQKHRVKAQDNHMAEMLDD